MTPPLSQQARMTLQRLKHAFTRGGGIYPLKGVYHFLSHRYLHHYLRLRLTPALLLSLFVTVNLFLWTYLPQVALLGIFHRRSSAWLNGTVLVLSESALATALLFEAFFVDETQVDIFDAVLVERGHEALVRSSRPVLAERVNTTDDADADADAVANADADADAHVRAAAAAAGGDRGSAAELLNPRQRLLKPSKRAIYAPFSLRQIIEFILLLPLNLVPWAGVPLFLLLTGYRSGPLLHTRYFALRGFTRTQRRRWISEHRWGYTWYGAVGLVLQLVPVLSMMFLLTGAVAGALWAVDMEDERLRRDSRAAGQEEDGSGGGAGTEYSGQYRDEEDDDDVAHV